MTSSTSLNRHSGVPQCRFWGKRKASVSVASYAESCRAVSPATQKTAEAADLSRPLMQTSISGKPARDVYSVQSRRKGSYDAFGTIQGLNAQAANHNTSYCLAPPPPLKESDPGRRSTSPSPSTLSAATSTSFLRSRAGSTVMKAPPLPLNLSNPRKGSLPLPSLAESHAEKSNLSPPTVLGRHARSSSLPEKPQPPIPTPQAPPAVRSTSAQPHTLSNHPLQVPHNTPQRKRVLEAHTFVKASPSTHEETVSVVATAVITPQQAVVAPLPIVPPSPMYSEYSNACASSILSYNQSRYAESLAVHRNIPSRAAAIVFEEPSITIKRASETSESDTKRRSDAVSVPHDVLPSPAMPQSATQHFLDPPVQAYTPRAANSATSSRSFDIGSVPFSIGNVPPVPLAKEVHNMPITPTDSWEKHRSVTTSTSKGGFDYASQTRSRKDSLSSSNHRRDSRSSIRSFRRRRSTMHSILAAYTSSCDSHSRTSSRRPSAVVIDQLLSPSTASRPFPWKPVKVSEAKKQISAKQLQQIVLQSMREYASCQDQALVLEGFEDIPLELEQCTQRLQDLRAAYDGQTAQRATLLARHVACLRVLNGDQGARFAETLAYAVTRGDRLAQEIVSCQEHTRRVEAVRESHWRATAALSLSRLNTSYLKAKEDVLRLQKELQETRADRDMVVRQLQSIKEAAKSARGSTLTLPVSTAGPSPLSSMFDVASFPAPPPPRADHYDGARTDYRFPLMSDNPNANLEKQHVTRNFTSLPTPPLSEARPESRSASPASTQSSLFRSFIDKAFSTSAQTRASLTPPPDSADTARFRDRSLSEPGPSVLLDPRVDLYSPDVETLSFLPPSMHLLGAMDDQAASARVSNEVSERVSVDDDADRYQSITRASSVVDELMERSHSATQRASRVNVALDTKRRSSSSHLVQLRDFGRASSVV